MAKGRMNHIPDNTSRALTLMQVFLAVAVVCAHSPLTPASELSAYGVTVVSTICTRIAMFPFFIISGYLLFIRTDSYGPYEYRDVLRRKARTLLVPYVIWCILSWAARYAADPSAPHPPLYHLNHVFFPGFNGQPYGLDLLWYFYQLMTLILVSPLIYSAVRLLRRWAVPVSLALWVALRVPGAGVDHNDWIGFLVGSSLALNRIDFMQIMKKALPFTGALWLVLVPFYVHYATLDRVMHIAGDAFEATELLFIFISDMALFGLASEIADFTPGGDTRRRRQQLYAAALRLAPFTLFIILMHALPQIEGIFLGISGAAEPWLPDGTAGHDLLYYTLLIPVRIALIVGIGMLLSRYTPGLWALLTGGRGARRADRDPAVRTA